MTNKKSIRTITVNAIIAAIYVVLTVTPPLNAISYGAIQFRLAETLNFLPFYNKNYIWGVTLGCFVSNLFSPNIASMDMVVGTLQTLVTLIIGVWLFDRYKQSHIIVFNKAFILFAFFDAIFGMAIIAAELTFIYKLPFLYTWLTVALGEFITLLIGGLLIDKLSKRIDFGR